MKSPFRKFLVAVAAIMLTACAPRVTYQPQAALEIGENATFRVEQVTKQLLYEDKTDFDIATRMKTAMNNALAKKNALSESSGYKLDIIITYYKQGNAALNFFIGGRQPELFATAYVYNNAGELVGTLQSTTNRGRGGIKGWNRIFDIVAEEFVENLTDSSARKSNRKPGG